MQWPAFPNAARLPSWPNAHWPTLHSASFGQSVSCCRVWTLLSIRYYRQVWCLNKSTKKRSQSDKQEVTIGLARQRRADMSNSLSQTVCAQMPLSANDASQYLRHWAHVHFTIFTMSSSYFGHGSSSSLLGLQCQHSWSQLTSDAGAVCPSEQKAKNVSRSFESRFQTCWVKFWSEENQGTHRPWTHIQGSVWNAVAMNTCCSTPMAIQ